MDWEFSFDFRGQRGAVLRPFGDRPLSCVGAGVRQGTCGAAIMDELAPAGGDIVNEGKRGLDTFASPVPVAYLRRTPAAASAAVSAPPNAATADW